VGEQVVRWARDGFGAWQRGDFDSVEALLDPEVTWHAVEPGPWDCDNRRDVMETVRERYRQGFAGGRLEFVEAAPDSVIVVSHPSEIAGPEWPDETATLIRFRGRRVLQMQDYLTRADALAAHAGGAGS
jgi:ketosteroid isomerase-like protein